VADVKVNVDVVALPKDLAEQFARLRIPDCARMLGIEVLSFDRKTNEVVVAAFGRPEFRNPMGAIQGGFLCAMLDDTMALAALFASNFQSVVPTLEMKTSFYAPAEPGTIKGVGRVARLGKTIAFLEGELRSASGEIIAKASATARLAPLPKG
jgi:uncharacterized protein (TIGR00369 family)